MCVGHARKVVPNLAHGAQSPDQDCLHPRSGSSALQLPRSSQHALAKQPWRACAAQGFLADLVLPWSAARANQPQVIAAFMAHTLPGRRRSTETPHITPTSQDRVWIIQIRVRTTVATFYQMPLRCGVGKARFVCHRARITVQVNCRHSPHQRTECWSPSPLTTNSRRRPNDCAPLQCANHPSVRTQRKTKAEAQKSADRIFANYITTGPGPTVEPIYM